MPVELVSIIMPAYNSAATISESIVSALSQSHRDLERVIVDDGSTDDTADICRRHAVQDNRVRLISQANRGVSAARNTGIKAAQGEYVAFLDADDLWDKEKIEQQMVSVRTHPGTIVLTGMIRFSGDGEARRFLTTTNPPPFLDQGRYARQILNLQNHEMGSFGTALVPRHCLNESFLFDERLRTSEDWDLWLRLAFRYPFENINKPLRLYRKYAGSLTTQTRMQDTLTGQLYIIKKIEERKLLSEADINMARMNKYLEFAGHYRYIKRYLRSFLMVTNAAWSYPEGFRTLICAKLNKSRH